MTERGVGATRADSRGHYGADETIAGVAVPERTEAWVRVRVNHNKTTITMITSPAASQVARIPPMRGGASQMSSWVGTSARWMAAERRLSSSDALTSAAAELAAFAG